MPSVVVRIPTPLRAYTGGADEVAVEAATVFDALSAVGRRHEGILERVLAPDGQLRQFVNVYLGAQNVRVLKGLATPLAEGDVLAIVPAVAGGKGSSVNDSRVRRGYPARAFWPQRIPRTIDGGAL